MEKEKMISIFRNCENLVGKRFNFKTLEDELNNRFGIKGYLALEYETEQIDPDFRTTYAIDNEHCFDIFYLKMRYEGYFGESIYITEIGCDIY